MVLLFWCWLTQVVLEKRPLNECSNQECQKLMQKAVRLSCGVCGRVVGNNSMQCTSCQKGAKRCTGIKGSMSKVMKSFICRSGLNPVTATGRTNVDIGASANLELVDKFCYLGDILSVDGDADAVMEAGIRIGCNNVRQLVPLFVRLRLYSSLYEVMCCMEVRLGL